MKKILAALTILIITCTFSAGAGAAPPKQGKGKNIKKDRPRPCMNLTEAQQKQLKDLHQKFIDDTYEMRADIMNLDHQIRMYMETSHPDPAKLKSMIMEKADLEKDLAVKRMEFALDARKISPELKSMPMGPRCGGPGMGMGHGPRGNGGPGKGPGFNGNPGQGFDYPPMMNDNQGPQNSRPSQNN